VRVVCESNEDCKRRIDRATPDAWAALLSAPADYSSSQDNWPAALLRHWTGTSAYTPQPSLDHHYIAQHLGGSKHVERRHDGRTISKTVASGALTFVCAGTQYDWHTRGPVEFAHLYVPPGYLERLAERLDRKSAWTFPDAVGVRDPLLESLFSEMLREIRHPNEASALYLDSLLDAFAQRLLRDHSAANIRQDRPREILTKFQVARVVEYIDANLACDIKLADLVSVVGGSVYHFCRAFKNATGEPPYQFAMRHRLEHARVLLKTTELSVTDVAGACGFRNAVHFERAFNRQWSDTPMRFRREHGRVNQPQLTRPANRTR
jgi:AraC family transcriptional regulator